MVYTTFKWKGVLFSFVILFYMFTLSFSTAHIVEESIVPKLIQENENVTIVKETVNTTRGGLRQNIRPGQTVLSYEVEITVKEDSFDGRVVLEIRLSHATREDRIVLLVKDLLIKSVKVGIFIGIYLEVEFYVENELLYIDPPIAASIFNIVIEYSGQLANDGHGLHLGKYNQNFSSYVSMNLHPSYASRVFPCMDELTQNPVISFKFNNLEYSDLVSNSLLEQNSANQFQPLAGPPSHWGMMAHNFEHFHAIYHYILLYGRPGVLEVVYVHHVIMTIFTVFSQINNWTNKEYTEIVQNQDKRLHIFGLPDVSTDWNALSIIGIWEHYLFLDPNHVIKLQTEALPKIAEAIAKQWFGYVIYPQNRRYEWVVSGLASYAGWEMIRLYRNFGTTQLDVNTLFVTDVIQEGLLRDSYSSSKALEPENDLFDEDVIRDHIGVNGILKYKAPVLLRMMRTALGDADTDYIQLAAQELLHAKSLQGVNTVSFIDAVKSEWLGSSNNNIVGAFDEFLEPWIQTSGYPLLHITRVNSNTVMVLQESFGFSNKQQVRYQVPLTYTTSSERNFDEDNTYPVTMLDSAAMMLNVPLGSEDWILFNIQGQGFYRVNYEVDLWEKIIKALENPETRKQIHPLNRATLVDDALNLARAGKLDYDIAFKLVLTMEHETEYAPWKAFVRNMDFLRKRLVAYARVDEDLDSDIYLRMIKKTLGAFEDQIGFYPDVPWMEQIMETLTRSLVMDHACRANYQPCITAAKEWFYDPYDEKAVNPSIPHDIRSAVYCTMVREGDEKIIDALNVRLEFEPTLSERLVILESLACSQDEDFINRLLEQTIASNSSYGVEERVKIFNAIAESSYANANIARQFLRLNTAEIRKMYGGSEKLEEVTFVLSDNMADENLSFQFSSWVCALNNNLQDSQLAADRALEQVNENLLWNSNFKQYVYSWIVDHAS